MANDRTMMDLELTPASLPYLCFDLDVRAVDSRGVGVWMRIGLFHVQQ